MTSDNKRFWHFFCVYSILNPQLSYKSPVWCHRSCYHFGVNGAAFSQSAASGLNARTNQRAVRAAGLRQTHFHSGTRTITCLALLIHPDGWKSTDNLLPSGVKADADHCRTVMARNGSGSPFSRGNIKLDSFLRRNTDQGVYERIRFYEPCVVISETINKAYMHVVLSGERVFLTEYTPRTLTTALSLRRVRDIELVR